MIPRITWLLAAPILAVSAACASMMPRAYVQRAQYETALVEVARPLATRERWGLVEKIVVDSSRFAYEDSMVKVLIGAATSAISFAITNKTEHSIKLIWDEAAFVDADGKVSKIMHEGVSYANRAASQPPSIVPSGQTYSDAAFPNDRVYFAEGFYGAYYTRPAEWKHVALILPAEYSQQIQSGGSPVANNAFVSEVQANKGKRFGLILPLQIEGITNEYTFWFEITSASVVDPPAVPY